LLQRTYTGPQSSAGKTIGEQELIRDIQAKITDLERQEALVASAGGPTPGSGPVATAAAATAAGATATGATGATVRNVGPDLGPLQTEVTNLVAQIAALTSALTTAQAAGGSSAAGPSPLDLTGVRTDLGALHTSVTQVANALTAMQTAGAPSLQQELTNISTQIAALATALNAQGTASSSAASPSNPALAGLHNDFVALQAEVARIANALANPSSASANPASANPALTTLQQDLQAATDALAAANTSHATDLATAASNHAAALAAANTSHAAALAVKDGDLTTLRVEKAGLKAQLDALQPSNSSSSSSATRTPEKLENENASLQASLTAANEAHANVKAALDKRVEDLTLSNETQTAEIEQYAQDIGNLRNAFAEESQNFRDESKVQIDALAKLESELNAAKEAAAKVAEATARISTLEGQNGTLTTQVASMTAELDALNAASAAAVTKAAQNATSEQAAAIAALRAEVDAAKAAKAACEQAAQKAQQQCAFEHGAAEALQEEYEALVAKINEGEYGSTYVELPNIIAKVQYIQDYITRIKSEKAKCDENLEQQKAALQEVTNALQSNSSGTSTLSTEALVAQINALRLLGPENNALKSQMEQLNNLVAAREATIAANKVTLEALGSASKSLEAQLESMTKKSAANVAAARATATTAQKQALDELIAELAAVTDALTRERTTCANTTREQAAEIAKLTAERKTYLQLLESERNFRREESAACNAQLSKEGEEYDMATARVAKLSEDLERSRRNCQNSSASSGAQTSTGALSASDLPVGSIINVRSIGDLIPVNGQHGEVKDVFLYQPYGVNPMYLEKKGDTYIKITKQLADSLARDYSAPVLSQKRSPSPTPGSHTVGRPTSLGPGTALYAAGYNGRPALRPLPVSPPSSLSSMSRTESGGSVASLGGFGPQQSGTSAAASVVGSSGSPRVAPNQRRTRTKSEQNEATAAWLKSLDARRKNKTRKTRKNRK
jgi:DNA repair exonuclease SbcCD ATPase subunit